MIFSPLLSELSALPLTYLVTPADEQTVEGQTACWCPFCRQQSVGRQDGVVKRNVKGSNTPHFIIYNNEYGGLYNCNHGKGAQRWSCTRQRKSGHGALELYAAIHGLTLEGDNLRQTCRGLLLRLGYTDDDIAEKYPAIAHLDYRTRAERPSEKFLFDVKVDFTPQELMSLGCEVRRDKNGVDHFSFAPDVLPSENQRTIQQTYLNINKDFRIYSLDHCTLPNVARKGEAVSEIIHGTDFSPLFVCFATDEEDCGCVFRPATDQPPIVFSNNDNHTVAKISKWLSGDYTFVQATEHRDSNTTAVARAVADADEGEVLVTTRDEWHGEKNSKDKMVYEKVSVEIPSNKQKAKHIVYCNSPQDAITTYYTLRTYRLTHPDNTELQEECWYHVAFLFGKSNFVYMEHGEWKKSSVEFGVVQHRKLSYFADNIILLFPNDNKSFLKACTIARRFRDMSLAQLPINFRSAVHQLQPRLYQHNVSSVRDFMLVYRMDEKQSFQYDRDLRRFFHSILRAALPSAPLQEMQKRDRNNAVIETYYVINPATLFTFLMCEGYARDVDLDTNDKIGNYIHIEGCFVESFTRESMVSEAKRALTDYAHQTARDNEHYKLMITAILRATKEVNEHTMDALPIIKPDYEGAYGPNFDHLFFRNCALKITPTDIYAVKYSDIDFHIDRRAVLDYDFRIPQATPFTITENPEYRQRLKEINDKAAQKDSKGNPVYTMKQVSQMRSELEEWGRVYRWQTDWFGQRERDMWPTLRILRGFANIKWEMEEDLLRSGKEPSDHDKAILSSHFANFIFGIGRVLWRFRENPTNVGLYLMENSVADNRKAQGGSGKSTLANVILACAGRVFSVDCKRYATTTDYRFALAGFIKNVFRVVHWEDAPKAFPIKMLYNYISSDFTTERKHGDISSIKLSEGPSHVISSNYAMSDVEDSTLRRFCMIPFSDRFCGENVMMNKPARKISDIMPDFSTDGIRLLSNPTRCQFAYIGALAMQFCMKYNSVVNAPIDDIKHRQMVSQLTDNFVRWADYFFSQSHVYGIPIDLDSAWQEYVREFTDSSETKQKNFARYSFKKNVQEYCQFNGIVMNPPHLLTTKKAQQQNYFQLQAWVTREYFTGKEWQGDDTIQPKLIRELHRSEYVCFFYRASDKVPVDEVEFKEVYERFKQRPDPAPILDDKGDYVRLTEDERRRWQDFLDSRQRKRYVHEEHPQQDMFEQVAKESMPF